MYIDRIQSKKILGNSSLYLYQLIYPSVTMYKYNVKVIDFKYCIRYTINTVFDNLLCSFLKMADNADRKLRVRKPPHYFLAENQETELLGYARTNFTKDFTSPAQELNSMAKILAKFVNVANKRLTQKNYDNQDKDVSALRMKDQDNDQQTRKAEKNVQGDKKRANSKYESKDHNRKTGKDNGGIKGTNTDGKDRVVSGDQYKKGGELNKNSKQNSKPDIQGSLGYINKLQELKQHQSIGLSNLSKHNNQLDAATRAIQQQQQLLLSYNPTLRQKLQGQSSAHSRSTLPSTLNSNQNNTSPQNSEKFFRRSTYHIAIAYHIHLNNIKESGKDMQTPMILDPTYHAKRLKGESEVPVG